MNKQIWSFQTRFSSCFAVIHQELEKQEPTRGLHHLEHAINNRLVNLVSLPAPNSFLLHHQTCCGIALAVFLLLRGHVFQLHEQWACTKTFSLLSPRITRLAAQEPSQQQPLIRSCSGQETPASAFEPLLLCSSPAPLPSSAPLSAPCISIWESADRDRPLRCSSFWPFLAGRWVEEPCWHGLWGWRIPAGRCSVEAGGAAGGWLSSWLPCSPGTRPCWWAAGWLDAPSSWGSLWLWSSERASRSCLRDLCPEIGSPLLSAS